MWFACFALKRRVRWLWKARIPQDKNCWREIFCFQFHIGVLFRIQSYKHMMKTWKENEWLHLKTKASLFLNGMDAHHVDDAGMLDHVTAQAIPIWLWIPHWHGMCASFGWEPAPFFDPLRSVPRSSTGAMKRKKNRHTRVLSYPPSTSSDLPKDLLRAIALVYICLLVVFNC